MNTHHSRIALLTIIALGVFALCCQSVASMSMHNLMQKSSESMMHAVLLVMNLPETTSLLTLFIFAFILAVTSSPQNIHHAFAVRRYQRASPPDTSPPMPLHLAFATGILNPKPY